MFDLGGFEFLLDTIGLVGNENEQIFDTKRGKDTEEEKEGGMIDTSSSQ